MNAYWTKRLVTAALFVGLAVFALGGCNMLGTPGDGVRLGRLLPSSGPPPQWEPEVADSSAAE